MTTRKKLIEVALPLEAINKESAREKSIRHGHPSTLHLWWARRPLAACRAVLFASLVDDPSSLPEQFPTEEAQEHERQRLFRIIEELVKWENSNNELVLEAARAEIMRSTGGNPPPVYDPFCGGGSIPLEAQRLGLEAHASDLNPVAVLITKALIEIPPKFAGRPPVNPEARAKIGHGDGWRGAQGLAEDVRYYGRWMRDEAERRIGHLYPKVKLPQEHGGGEATVIAWLWARTVKCPNPACGARMPLVRSFWLSTKKTGSVYAHPVCDRERGTVRFDIRTDGVPEKETSNRDGARCLFCGTNVKKAQLRDLAVAHGVSEIPLAVVCEGPKGRIYLPSDRAEVPDIQRPVVATIEQQITNDRRWFSPPLYGLPNFSDLFASRQLMALTTFSDLAGEAHRRLLEDARAAGVVDDGIALNDCGKGAAAYADAVATYLAFALSKMADRGSSICTWFTERDSTRNTFARQAIPMAWDFAELNTLLGGTGSFVGAVDWTAESLCGVPSSPVCAGISRLKDAASGTTDRSRLVVSTDPPYYDNIGYADLSDFFYVWLRRSLASLFPDLFSTLLTPKAQELVAAPHRFGGSRAVAREFFEAGLAAAFSRMRESQHSDYPLTLFYAFKQAESSEEQSSSSDSAGSAVSTGWETMLQGLLDAGFAITGTWPMRSELSNRPVASGTNALSSSIVLVCRPRSAGAPSATRREFLSALKRELPDALQKLQHGNIAPVDLAQAAIGPGMGVYSRYSQVLEANGTPMRVHAALALINQTLDEVLAEQEGEFDGDTRWTLAWFEQYAMDEGPFGVAETLSKAKNTAVSALAESGILQAKAGKVRLLKREELPADRAPTRGSTAWEVTQHLICALEKEGEAGAAALVREVGAAGEAARDLAYRLYSICERKKWAQEALAYNSLVIAWPEITRLAASSEPIEAQPALTLE